MALDLSGLPLKPSSSGITMRKTLDKFQPRDIL